MSVTGVPLGPRKDAVAEKNNLEATYSSWGATLFVGEMPQATF